MGWAHGASIKTVTLKPEKSLSRIMSHWTLEQIPWSSFDPSKVDPELVKVVKAAAMVEFNGGNYAGYLCPIFGDDFHFASVINRWAVKEGRNRTCLSRCARMADRI